jgi:hypothetical protein
MEQHIVVSGSDTQIMRVDLQMVWPLADCPPAKRCLTMKSGPEWEQSEIIWIRVAEKRDKLGNLIRAAHTTMGRCVWPKEPKAFHPVNDLPDSPVTVEWETTPFFYESFPQCRRVEATHWFPIVEPTPPGTVIPQSSSAASVELITLTSWVQ